MGPAKIGETWILKRRWPFGEITLTLRSIVTGNPPKEVRGWYYPGSLNRYDNQDLVGLVGQVM